MGRAKRLRKERAARRRARRAERERIDRLICAQFLADVDHLQAAIREANRSAVIFGAWFDQVQAYYRDQFAALRDHLVVRGTPAQKRAVVRWRNRKAMREVDHETP